MVSECLGIPNGKVLMRERCREIIFSMVSASIFLPGSCIYPVSSWALPSLAKNVSFSEAPSIEKSFSSSLSLTVPLGILYLWLFSIASILLDAEYGNGHCLSFGVLMVTLNRVEKRRVLSHLNLMLQSLGSNFCLDILPALRLGDSSMTSGSSGTSTVAGGCGHKWWAHVGQERGILSSFRGGKLCKESLSRGLVFENGPASENVLGLCPWEMGIKSECFAMFMGRSFCWFLSSRTTWQIYVHLLFLCIFILIATASDTTCGKAKESRGGLHQGWEANSFCPGFGHRLKCSVLGPASLFWTCWYFQDFNFVHVYLLVLMGTVIGTVCKTGAYSANGEHIWPVWTFHCWWGTGSYCCEVWKFSLKLAFSELAFSGALYQPRPADVR